MGTIDRSCRRRENPNANTQAKIRAAGTSAGEPRTHAAAAADGASVTRKVTPQSPVTEAICSSGRTSVCVYARLNAVPCGESSDSTNSPAVHVAGNANAAIPPGSACIASRADRTAVTHTSDVSASMTMTIGSGITRARNVSRFRLPAKQAAKAMRAAVRARRRAATTSTGIGAIHTAGQNGPRPIER